MSQERNTPEGAWKSQAEEQAMQIATTPDELCTMARSREKLNARVTAAVATVTVLLSAMGFAERIKGDHHIFTRPDIARDSEPAAEGIVRQAIPG